MILLADSEGIDQTALVHRLIWAFAIHIPEDTFAWQGLYIDSSVKIYGIYPKYCNNLTFTTLWADSADDILMICLFFINPL